MSFREKLAWVCLLSTAVIWSPYFAYTLGRGTPGDLGAGSILGAFIAAVVLQVVVGVVATIVIAARAGRELKDERDAAIEARAVKVAYYLLITLGFSAACFALSTVIRTANPPAGGPAILLVGQWALLCFVIAEAARFLTQVVGYRRGA